MILTMEIINQTELIQIKLDQTGFQSRTNKSLGNIIQIETETITAAPTDLLGQDSLVITTGNREAKKVLNFRNHYITTRRIVLIVIYEKTFLKMITEMIDLTEMKRIETEQEILPNPRFRRDFKKRKR